MPQLIEQRGFGYRTQRHDKHNACSCNAPIGCPHYKSLTAFPYVKSLHSAECKLCDIGRALCRLSCQNAVAGSGVGQEKFSDRSFVCSNFRRQVQGA